MTKKMDQEPLRKEKKEGNIQLWQFILELLNDPTNSDTVRWTSQNGDFQVLDPENLAKLWGQKKGRVNMTYDKLCRALRYYYAKDILIKVPGQRYSYRFLWKPSYSVPSWVVPNLQSIPANYATGLRIPSPLQSSYTLPRNYGLERGLNNQEYGKTYLDPLREYETKYGMPSASEYNSYRTMYRSPEQSSMQDAISAMCSSYRPHELRYPDPRDTRQTWVNSSDPVPAPYSQSSLDAMNALYPCQYNYR